MWSAGVDLLKTVQKLPSLQSCRSKWVLKSGASLASGIILHSVLRKLLHCRQCRQHGEAFVLPAGMQVDSSDKAEARTAGTDGEMDSTAGGGKEGGAEGQAEGQKAKAPKEPEPSSHNLDNPARVVPAQEKLVKFPEGSRYVPIRSGRTAGILLLKDSTPGTRSNQKEKKRICHH